ncbi:MAG: enoyl-CoA hydratase/isomerase family protein [Carbonactinosporaceae bacterium]
MADPVIRYELSDGVATVTLDRPDAMNALDTALKEGLRDRLAEASGNPDVRAVVLTGSGRSFSVGQDLREHQQNLAGGAEAALTTVARHYNPIATALATMPKPVIAAINGVAAGAGASFAFACDFRILADSASFNLAFASIGLTADSGASWTLPRLVGLATAREMLMLPETISAQRAAELGLATRVVPAGELLATAYELARTLAAGPTVAYGAIKRSLAYAQGRGLDEALDFENGMQTLAGATEDHRRAVEAFMAKQKPTFRGR